MPKAPKLQSAEDILHKKFVKVKKEAVQRILNKKNGINWGCEIKIINKLADTYPDIEFWRTFEPNFSFTLPSLAWLLTEKGRDYLSTEYRRATTDLSALISKPEKYEHINDDVPVEKVEIKKKLLTLKDFLR